MSTIVTRAGKGSALTWTEGDANFTNLNDDKLENIVEDTTPQLGGNLDVNGNDIVSASNADITIAPNGTGIVLVVSDLEVGYGTGTAAITSAGAYDLDLVTNGGVDSGLIRIVDGANGNILLQPNGSGHVHIVADALRLGDLNTEARISTYGTGDLVLTTNEGNDPDPTITIGNGANANITLTPSGTGDVVLSADTVQIGDSNANATITTNGTGDLILNTNNGSNSGAITIADAANGNISITPNGTGKSVVSAINYNEGAIHTVTYAATITPNVTNGNVQTVTLTGNVTFSAFASPIAGQSLTLKVVQDATGSRLLTSTMKFAGASKTLSTAANSIDIISVYYDGTNYFASLAKGFA